MLRAINCRARPLISLSVLLSFSLLSACASPAAKTYLLAATEGQPPQGRPVTISVEMIDIAKYLDRPQLVHRADDVELGISEFERWGEPLGTMTQRVLAEDLRGLLPAGSVVTTSQDTSGKEAFTLELSISRFESSARGGIVLDAQWQLHRRSGASGPRKQANIVVPATAGDTATQVKAMSAALDQLARRIAADVR